MAETPPPMILTKAEQRERLEKGERVISGTATYEVDSLLGAGGFGDVYKVFNIEDKRVKYAMKTEIFDPRAPPEMMNRLKIETEVFMDIAKPMNRLVDKSRFIRMIDKGKSADFKFLIMEMISHSILDIHNNMMNKRTSAHSLIHIGRETLRSIESLHEIGYLHRDIKGPNFAVGLPPKEAIIYMLDFGIARRFREIDGRLRLPRRQVNLLGTHKYASRNALRDQEQSRKDDLESWIYMMLDLYGYGNVNFGGNTTIPFMLAKKDEMMTQSRKMHDDGKLWCPERFVQFMEFVDKMSYTSQGDYVLFNKIFDGIVKDENINEKLPLDWIGREMPVDPIRVKRDKEVQQYLKAKKKARRSIEEKSKPGSRSKASRSKHSSSDERRGHGMASENMKDADHKGTKRPSPSKDGGSDRESEKSDRLRQGLERDDRHRRSQSKDRERGSRIRKSASKRHSHSKSKSSEGRKHREKDSRSKKSSGGSRRKSSSHHKQAELQKTQECREDETEYGEDKEEDGKNRSAEAILEAALQKTQEQVEKEITKEQKKEEEKKTPEKQKDPDEKEAKEENPKESDEKKTDDDNVKEPDE